MSCFYFAYFGNKRTEFKYIEELLKDVKYDKFIEPFCGSCSTSYLNYYSGLDKIDYYLNDNDKDLIDFLKDVKQNGCKTYFEFCKEYTTKDFTREKHNKQIDKYKENKHTLHDYFYYNKVYNFRKAIFPDPNVRKISDVNYLKYDKWDKFFCDKHVNLSNLDYIEIMEKFKDDENALIYLDPPYFSSFNGAYSDYTNNTSNVVDGIDIVKDNTFMYVYFVNFIKTCKCKVLMIINRCSILEYLYKPYIHKFYDKNYGTTKMNKDKVKYKTQTQHMIILK